MNPIAEAVLTLGHEAPSENPLIEGLERLPVHPTALVIFRATGDLGVALRGRHPMWVIRGDSGASMFDARARDGRASRTAWGLRESEDEQIDGE